MTHIAALVLAAGILAGCQNTIGLTSSFCDPRSGIEAIRLSPDERAALATEPKRIILAINKFGERNCRWKP